MSNTMKHSGVCVESNIATVALAGVPTITVHRVLRSEGWTVRFDIEDQRGINLTAMIEYLIEQGYTRPIADRMGLALQKLVFGPHEVVR